MRSAKKPLTRLVVIVVVAIVFFVFWTIYCGVATSLTAERSLHANLLVVDLVQEYVAGNMGAWPRSWHDLETLPARQRAGFEWPRDREEVARFVEIDFSIDSDALASESHGDFTAIRPKGVCYPYKDQVTRLLDTIRQTRRPVNKTVAPRVR